MGSTAKPASVNFCIQLSVQCNAFYLAYLARKMVLCHLFLHDNSRGKLIAPVIMEDVVANLNGIRNP